jgi:hypothetical protein
MRRHKVTDEERAVKQIAKIISDLRLDLELMGFLLAFDFPNSVVRRLTEVSEVAQDNKTKMSERNGII